MSYRNLIGGELSTWKNLNVNSIDVESFGETEKYSITNALAFANINGVVFGEDPRLYLVRYGNTVHGRLLMPQMIGTSDGTFAKITIQAEIPASFQPIDSGVQKIGTVTFENNFTSPSPDLTTVGAMLIEGSDITLNCYDQSFITNTGSVLMDSFVPWFTYLISQEP